MPIPNFILRFQDQFFSRRGSKRTAKLIIGTAIAQGLGIIFYPFLARIYSPEEMGMYGLFSSFIGMVCVGTSLRFETASVVARSPREGMALVNLSFILTIPISIILSLILYALIQKKLLGFEGLSFNSVPLTWLSLMLIATFTILRFWLVREGEFGLIARITAHQIIIRLLSQSLLGIFGLGWVGLGIGELLGRGVGVKSAWAKVRGTWKRWGNLNFNRLKIVALRYSDYFVFGLPSSILDSTSANIAVPLFASFYGLEAAGNLALVQRVLSAPVTLIAGSVGEVYHSRIAEIQRSGNGSAEKLFRFIAAKAFLLSLPCAGLLMLFGKSLAVFIFGTRWEAAGLYTVLLAPKLMMQFVVTPLCRTVFVYKGQKVKLIYDVFVLLGSVIVLIMGPSSWKWSDSFTVAALSAVNTIGLVIYFFLTWLLIRGK